MTTSIGVLALASRRHRAAIESLQLSWRYLIEFTRDPLVILFGTLTPILLLVLLNSVFGGSVHTGVKYVQFLVPAMLIWTTVFASVNTAMGIATDMSSGVVDRFRSMPIS